MLGSVGDAEDVAQEALLRWHEADRSDIRSPEAWLATVATRLALDQLRRHAAERAAYVGPWVPEPWLDAEPDVADDPRPDRRLERAGDLSMAAMALLERLGPKERAAFLLHEVYDIDHPTIASTLAVTEANSRQMVRRARQRVREARPRFAAGESQQRDMLRRLLAAARAQDQARVLELLAPDIRYVTDGGGRRAAALRPVTGTARVARLVVKLWEKTHGRATHRLLTINAQPALVTWLDGEAFATLSLDVEDGSIRAVHRVLNPDKLRRIAALGPGAGEPV